jgi:hypothetical protein
VTREIKAMLSDMFLKPAPTIFDVDTRGMLTLLRIPHCSLAHAIAADASVLEPLILKLTEGQSLPVLIIGGHPITDVEVIRNLNADGTLKKMVSTAGAKIDGARRKKGGH